MRVVRILGNSKFSRVPAAPGGAEAALIAAGGRPVPALMRIVYHSPFAPSGAMASGLTLSLARG
jgi:hypothetical protein